MAQGTMQITWELLDKSTPEFTAVLDAWLARGTEHSRVREKSGIYTLTLDHPDFWQDKQGVRYDLSITRSRGTDGNTSYVLSKLRGWGDDSQWHIAKDYLGEIEGTIHTELDVRSFPGLYLAGLPGAG